MSTGEEFLAVALSNNNIGMVHYKSIGLNEDINKEISAMRIALNSRARIVAETGGGAPSAA